MTSLRDGDLLLEFAELKIHPFHHVPAHYFRMVHAMEGAEMGSINLRPGNSPHLERYAGHIGYGVDQAYRGHRYASRSVLLLMPLARELKVDPLWITCDPENAASRHTLELAGAEFIEIVDVPEDCIIRQTGHPRKCRYRLAT